MTAPSPSKEPRYLWLTRFFPYPSHAGDRIYSARLIEALAAHECHVTAFCNEGEIDGALIPEGPARRAEWVGCPPAGSRWMLRYAFSRLPRQALRLSAPGPRGVLQALLARQDWDAVLIDYVTMGWTLPFLLETFRARSHPPTLVYVAHNHETSLRRQAYRRSTATTGIRLAQRIDGERIAAMEKRVLAAADRVTVITAADLSLFQADAPKQHYSILVPGYDGPRLAARRLTPETPRRVVVVGSFDWIVKQQNLLAFLEAAATPLARHRIGIDIVGSGPEKILAYWRRRFPSVTIHGRVDAVEPYLQGGRISIVPEQTGGGFKLKVLNAVFQRAPVFGLAGSITEVPLEDGQSLRLFPDFPALIEGVIQMIDDLDALNALQTAAYEACKDRFSWADRGRTLHKILSGQAPEKAACHSPG